MSKRKANGRLSVNDVVSLLAQDSDSGEEFYDSENEFENQSEISETISQVSTPRSISPVETPAITRGSTPVQQVDDIESVINQPQGRQTTPVQSESDSDEVDEHPAEVPLQQNVPVTAIRWEQYSIEDPYDPSWIGNLQNQRTGILVDTTAFDYADFFKLFFPDEIFDIMTAQTNMYAEQYLRSHPDLSRHSRFKKWTLTTSEEMRAYIALEIAMGINQRPVIEDYWSTYWLYQTKFANVMPRNRFELLTSFLHFNNNELRVPRGQEGHDALFKVRPLLNIVDDLYSSVYYPEKELAVDESMIKFKGRIFFRQYMPAKPTKWGLKTFALCESNTGYALQLLIYTGKGTFRINENCNLSITEQVVRKLLSGYENKGHVVYMDNYYSSPTLYLSLKNVGIAACGTVKNNRKFMPRELQPRQLHLNKGDPPVFMKTTDDSLVTCVMMDTKRVQFLSTVHTDLTIDKRVRSKNGEGGHRVIEKPVMGDDYNRHMNGVDLLDQKLGTYAYPHKSSKWYMTIFHRIREIALVNGYIIYSKDCSQKGGRPLEARIFREKVIDGLLEGWDTSNVRKKGHPSTSEKPGRLTERHFPDQYMDKKHRPECVVCSDRKTRGWKRVQTSFKCSECDLPMCPTACFRIYHTCLDFKTAAARQIYNLNS